MFLHASVILFTGGVSASVHAGIQPPRGGDPHPQEKTLTPRKTPPGAVHAGYGKQASGTHPTGMHTCYVRNLKGGGKLRIVNNKFQ